MIRFIFSETDATHTAGFGDDPTKTYRTLDIDVPEVEKWLSEKLDFIYRRFVGIEVLQRGADDCGVAHQTATWQPMETAPCDGTRILVAFKGYGVEMVRCFGTWASYQNERGMLILSVPLGWMPLPKMPDGEVKRGDDWTDPKAPTWGEIGGER